MIARRCTSLTCVDPEEVGCNRGCELHECEFWIKAQVPAIASAADADGDPARELLPVAAGKIDADDRVVRLPWTGNSLGRNDLPLVTACANTSLIGVVGPFNSGKTTLLTMMYLLVQRGETLRAGTFAGSLSLLGWENLAAKLRWEAGKGGPMFPPHTSRTAGRRPGLLHLGLRTPEHRREDFLLTDPPGEWFTLWTQKASADGAEGARWVHRHSRRFLFLVDREALSGEGRGKARDALRDLARRLSQGLGDRPVAVVWTKSDVTIPPTIEADLKACFSRELPGHQEFHVRLRFGDESRNDVETPCLALMDWAFSSQRERGTQPLVIPPTGDADAFVAYREGASQ